MKRNYFLFGIILLLNFFQLSAQDTNQQIQKFMEFYAKDEIFGMNQIAESIMKVDPDNYAGYAFKAYTSILKNDIASAEKFIATASSINPVDQGSYGIASYIAFINGKTSEARILVDFSFQIRPDDGLLKATMGDIEQIERITKKDMSALKEMVNFANTQTVSSPAIMQKYYSCMAQWQQGQECADIASVKTYFQKLQPNNPVVMAYADFYKGTNFYNAQKWDEAKIFGKSCNQK